MSDKIAKQNRKKGGKREIGNWQPSGSKRENGSGVDAVADGLDLVVLAGDVVEGVIHRQLRDEVVGRVGVIAAVRGEQHVVAADERAGVQVRVLALDHVECGAADVAVVERPDEILVADQRAAAFVDDDGVLLALHERFLVEHVVVLLGEVHVQAQHVGLGQQGVEIDELDAEVLGNGGRQEWVVGDDFHVERLRLAGDGLADATETGDAHDLTGDALETRHDLVIPDAVLLDTAVILADAALEVEHEGHGALGGFLRAAVEDGADGNALFLRVVEVGLVVARGLEGDDLAVIHGVDLFPAEVDVAVDNNIGVLDLGVERVVIFGVLVEHGHGQLCPHGDAGLLDADVSVFGIGHFCQNDFHGMISFSLLNGAAGFHGGDLRIGISEVAENAVRIGAEAACGRVGTHGVFRKLHRRARHHDLEVVLKGDLLDIAVGDGLLVGAHVADGAHALAGDVVFREKGFPLGDGSGLKDGVEPRDDLDDEVCLVQRLQTGGAGIVGDLRHAEQVGKLRKLAAVLVVEHADPLAVAALVEMAERVSRAQGGVRTVAAELRLVRHDADGVAPDEQPDDDGHRRHHPPDAVRAHRQGRHRGAARRRRAEGEHLVHHRARHPRCHVPHGVRAQARRGDRRKL